MTTPSTRNGNACSVKERKMVDQFSTAGPLSE
jgi:hypothetical protein